MAVDELTTFWQEVAAAYKQVAATHEREVTVSRNGKSATVTYMPSPNKIAIVITEVSTATKEALIAP